MNTPLPKGQPARPAFIPAPTDSSGHSSHRGRNPPDLLHMRPGDVGNAERVVALFGRDLRYCYDLNKWLAWDGCRWSIDGVEQARKIVCDVADAYLKQARVAGNEDAVKNAAKLFQSDKRSNALREAQVELPIRIAQLDSHPFLLNFLNGTLDLRTGKLMAHDREHFITKLVHHNYNPKGKAPTFEAFLARIMGHHADASEGQIERAARLIEYQQKAFGYSLTGVTSEKTVFLLHGNGDNGKSTLLNTFRELVDEYSALLQIDTLMVRQENNNTQADLADLCGARFVMTSETKEGQRLAEEKLKRITQGLGRIKATRKYENPIEFNETHKLWIDANHLPQIRGTDNAIWNRLHPIPFDVTIPKKQQDQRLPEKLLSEAEGILAWGVAGAIRWYTEGLGKPHEVEQMGAEWRAESNQIGRFIEERCLKGRYAQVKADALYQAYRKWTDEVGEKHTQTQVDFSKRVLDQGVSKRHTEYGNIYEGVGLLTKAEEAEG